MKKYTLTAFLMVILTLLSSCQTLSTVGSILPKSDTEITTSVKSAIYSNDRFAGVPIRIETMNGNVQLSGYVKTIRQSDEASDIASKVAGVKLVENNLIVRK